MRVLVNGRAAQAALEGGGGEFKLRKRQFIADRRTDKSRSNVAEIFSKTLLNNSNIGERDKRHLQSEDELLYSV